MDVTIGREDVEALGEDLARAGVDLGMDEPPPPPVSEAVGEYLLGCDLIVGAVPPKKPDKKPSKPSKIGGRPKKAATSTKKVGKLAVRFAQPGKRVSPHKLAIKRADKAVKRALTAGAQAEKKAKSYDPRKHQTVVPMGKVTVKGEECLGADRKLTPKQQAAVQRHVNAMMRHQKAVEAAKRAAATATATAKRLAGEVKKSAAKVKKLWAVPKTRILGEDVDIGELIGEEEVQEVLGEVRRTFNAEELGRRDTTRDPPDAVGEFLEEDLEWPEPVDKEGPIFTLETEDDYEWGEPVVDGDVLIMGEDGEGGTESEGGGEDEGEILPPVRGQPLARDEVAAVWKEVPEDGVMYDGAFPPESVGSANVMYSLDRGMGYVWEATSGTFPRPGEGGQKDTWYVASVGLGWPESSGQINVWKASQGVQGGPVVWTPPYPYAFLEERDGRRLYQYALPPGVQSAVDVRDLPYRAYEDELKQMFPERATAAASGNPRPENLYGVKEFGFPLVGDPRGKLAGLQYAVEGKKWFWQSHVAPKWATAEADAALALLVKQEREAKAAAAKAEQARRDQEAAERQEREDKLAAEIALAQTKADADEAIARQKIDVQQAELDAQLAAAEVQAQINYLKNPQAYVAPARGADEGYGGPPYEGDEGEGDGGYAPEAVPGDEYADLRYDPNDPNYADPTGPVPGEDEGE